MLLHTWYLVVLAIKTLCFLHIVLPFRRENSLRFVVSAIKPITDTGSSYQQWIPHRNGAVVTAVNSIHCSKSIRTVGGYLTKIKVSILGVKSDSVVSNDTDTSRTARTEAHSKLHADKNRIPVVQQVARTSRILPSPSPSPSSTSAFIHGMKDAVASACAAACCKAILQPIDAMKTVQQYYVGQQSLSLYQAAQLLVQKPGGYKNLYAGLGVTMIGSMPSVGLYFGVYSYCKQRFLATEGGRRHKTATIALSAAIGNTVASATRVPYEVMKQHLQTGLYDSTWSMFRDMIQNPDTITRLLFPKGGIWIQMIRDVPYAVVTLLLYESLQQHFKSPKKSSLLPVLHPKQHTPVTKSPLRDALLGGFAGGVGSWVTNPMDVIKTRLQTDTNSIRYSGSVVTCFNTVWKEGGASAFLRGSVPRLVHKVPANAFFFLFYEFFRRVLHT